MAGSSGGELRAPIFNGENYEFWSIRMKTIFKSHGLWELVEKGMKCSDSKGAGESEEKKKEKEDSSGAEKTLTELCMKDAKALGLIQGAVSDDIFPRISQEESSKGAWDILKLEFHGDKQEALDGLEFAIGNPNSTWGFLRAAMGHPEPFDLRYVAVGNEDCGKKNYRGNYLKFYSAIKRAYPDIKIISNCDGSSQKLDHPADLFDFHFYADDPKNMFSMAHHFDQTSRSGPKAFVSEYAVTTGSLLAALGEAGFLIGLEKNSDVVEMANYAPLFANDNGRNSKFSAIVFNSTHLYGTPSYWMQCLFKESSGATIFNATLQTNSSTNQVEQLLASAISWKNSENENSYLRIKIVNFGTDIVNLKIVVDGLEPNSINLSESTKTVLTSNNPMDENSLNEPKKVSESTCIL